MQRRFWLLVCARNGRQSGEALCAWLRWTWLVPSTAAQGRCKFHERRDVPRPAIAAYLREMREVELSFQHQGDGSQVCSAFVMPFRWVTEDVFESLRPEWTACGCGIHADGARTDLFVLGRHPYCLQRRVRSQAWACALARAGGHLHSSRRTGRWSPKCLRGTNPWLQLSGNGPGKTQFARKQVVALEWSGCCVAGRFVQDAPGIASHAGRCIGTSMRGRASRNHSVSTQRSAKQLLVSHRNHRPASANVPPLAGSFSDCISTGWPASDTPSCFSDIANKSVVCSIMICAAQAEAPPHLAMHVSSSCTPKGSGQPRRRHVIKHALTLDLRCCAHDCGRTMVAMSASSCRRTLARSLRCCCDGLS